MRLTCKPINVVAQSDESVVRPKIDEPNKRKPGPPHAREYPQLQ